MAIAFVDTVISDGHLHRFHFSVIFTDADMSICV